jgi:hypothetical protein
MTLAVYGIVRADHPMPGQPPPGVGEPAGELRLVRSGPLAAAVSEVADVESLGEQDAVAHLRILLALLSDGPVASLRLGTVAPDEESVRTEVLDPLADELRPRLDALEGRVELHLTVEEDEDAAVRAVFGAEPSLRANVDPNDIDARVELGQRVAEAVIDRRADLAEELLARLRPLAEDDGPRGHHGGVEDPALRWAFLVEEAAVPDFDQAVADLRADHPDLAVEYVGPLPPASFLTLSPAGEAAGGANDQEAPAGFAGSGQWGWDGGSG